MIKLVEYLKKVAYNLIVGFQNFTSHLLLLLIKKDLIMSAAQYKPNGRYLLYYADNNKLKPTKEILRLIYHKLQADPTYKNFGFNKVIFIHCFINGQKYAFHKNVLITNVTPFETYWSLIEEDIENPSDYWVEVIPSFEIKIWNIDLISNSNIKVNRQPTSPKPAKGFHSTVRGFHSLTSLFTPTLRGFHSLTSGFHSSQLARGFQSLARG